MKHRHNRKTLAGLPKNLVVVGLCLLILFSVLTPLLSSLSVVTGKASAATGPVSPVPIPNTSVINTEAKNFCQSYKTEKGVSASNRTKNFNACVHGYIAYASSNGHTNINSACSASNARKYCDAGYNQAKAKANNANPQSPGGGAPQHSTPASPSAPAANSASDVKCESSGFSLAWLFCDIITAMAGAIDTIYQDLIQPMLQTNVVNIQNIKADKTNTYKIWANFRLYGDLFLVIALLVIVFAEAIGGGFIDAYTAKKALPRLLLAAVLINLSIYIVAFAMDIANIVGTGLYALILAPFSGVNVKGAMELHISGAAGDLGMAAMVGGLAWASIGGVLSILLTGLLLPGLLIFLAILVTVILRQGIIIVLLFLSPIAFALYCLPNTEQYFRKWWDWLFRALLVYPIIAAIFGMSTVLSLTLNQLFTFNYSGAAQVFGQLIPAFGMLAPLILIPFSFQLAGGTIAQVSGLARRGVAPGLDTLKKTRAARRQEGYQKAQNFSRFSDRSALGRGANTLVGVAANPRSLLRGKGGVIAARKAGKAAAGAAELRENAIWNDGQGDDNFLMALTDRTVATQKLNSAIKKKEAAIAGGDMAGANAAQAEIDARQHGLDMAAAMGPMANNLGVRAQAFDALTKTGFQFDDGFEGYKELEQVTRSIAGNNEGARASLMNQGQYNLRSSGQRFDLGGINNGAGYDAKAGVGKASLYELANAKAGSITGMLEAAQQSENPDEARAILYHEFKAMIPNSKGVIRDQIVKRMDELEKSNIREYMSRETGKTISYTDPSTGQRRERSETLGDIAQAKARTYERPDPNRIENA